MVMGVGGGVYKGGNGFWVYCVSGVGHVGG